MPHLPLFRRKKAFIREGLPPSFLPSMVMPSVTANPSTTIPSVGDVSMASESLANLSLDVSRPSINASQSVRKALVHVSSASRDMAPVHIACRDWKNGEIFDWYRRQPNTTIRKLELRKEKDHFKHEYIVIYLDNGWYHRIERRPVQRNMDTISREGCEADDSLTPVSDTDLGIICSETDAEIVLEFRSNKPDLYNVIAVAVAIHLDPQAKRYTLQQYNCYFVARSIMALVTRHWLLQGPIMTGLQWDRLTESAIFRHIFGGDRNTLASVMKSSISAVLDSLLWDVIKADPGTRIEKSKDWSRLRDIARSVIHEEVETASENLAIDAVQKAVNEWIMDATHATLWHENLDQNLSEPQYGKKYETTAEGVMRAVLQPKLEAHLPDNMLKGLSEILPDRLINRVPPSLLAKVPPEMWARISTRVLEKLPDDLIAKLPYYTFRTAPAEFWQKLPVRVFSKAKDDLVLTLPDDLSIVPQRILDASLQRMQSALNHPHGHPDRVFAVKLLRRLPQEHLVQLPSSYISMRNLDANVEVDSSTGNQMGEEQTSAESAKNNRWYSPLGRIKAKWDKASFVGLLIRLAPMPVLKGIPPNMIDLIPTSSMVLIPTSALARLPSEYLAHVPTQYLERLPLEHLLNFPESLLSKAPRSTIERLPTSLLERLPAEFLRKLPAQFLDNLAEDLTDQIREIIHLSAFGSEELKQQLSGRVKEMLRKTLVVTSGKLSTTVIQVSVLTNEQKRSRKTLLKHEDLQRHILDMIRIHSKMVAQVPLLGMGEEKVYSGLRAKTEEIWQVMRLHPSLQDHS